jgi:FXSXX-COOH protein
MDDSDVEPEGTESDLVDVTRMPLVELIPSDDSVLANSLRRLLTDLDRPHEIVAAFANYAGGSDTTDQPVPPAADGPPAGPDPSA